MRKLRFCISPVIVLVIVFSLAAAGSPASAASRKESAETVKTGVYSEQDASDDLEQAIGSKSRITLNVQFDTNMDTIKEAYSGELSRFAHVMENHPELKVTIEGHTDNTGKEDSNLELSRKRAESVRRFLVAQGIDASRIDVQGYGQTRPVADNRTAEGKQKNRRVEAVLEYEKALFLKKKEQSK